MTRTYLYGYNGGRKSLAEMEQRDAWARVHPEMRRRLVALFDASQDAGHEVGFGEGWRSSAAQRQVFLERHTEVASGGCCGFDAKRWQLKANMAHAAPPGRSYHEETDAYGYCYAVDAVGDLTWLGATANAYGLVDFSDVNSEPWHLQPVELPTSRKDYTGQPLDVWPLPGPTPPPVPPRSLMFDHVYAYVTCNTSANPAVYVQLRSNRKVWLPSQDAYNAHKEMARTAGYAFKLLTYTPDQFRALGPVVGPRPARVDEWGV